MSTVTLYSDAVKLVRCVRHHFEGTSVEVRTASGPVPERADFVVTLGSLQRPVEHLAARLAAQPAVLPEALLYLTSAVFDRGDLVLVGSDKREVLDHELPAPELL
jgi:hypothetical protein